MSGWLWTCWTEKTNSLKNTTGIHGRASMGLYIVKCMSPKKACSWNWPLQKKRYCIIVSIKKIIKGIHMSKNLIKQNPQHQSLKMGFKRSTFSIRVMGPMKLWDHLSLGLSPFPKYGSLQTIIQKQQAIHSNKKRIQYFKTASLPKVHNNFKRRNRSGVHVWQAIVGRIEDQNALRLMASPRCHR